MFSEEKKLFEPQENLINNLASNLDMKIINLQAILHKRFDQSLKEIQTKLSDLSKTSTSSSETLSLKL